MKPRSEYLTHDWYDKITHTYFCAECHEPLERQGHVLRDHVLGVWRHYAHVTYPGIAATTETGHTIEGVWSQAPRTVKVLIPMQTQVRFCSDCFPLKQEHGIPLNLCYGCGTPILEENEVTKCELLWKRADGYNGPLVICALHMDCLPDHFGEVKDYRCRTRSDQSQ